MSWPSRLRVLQHQLLNRPWLSPLLLLATLLASAVAVSFSVHKSRGYLHELQALHTERDQLEVEFGQLLLEQQAWGAYARVGKLAVDQLGMRVPLPHDIVMVRP